MRKRLDAAAEAARKAGNIAGEVAAIKELRAIEELEIRLEQNQASAADLTAHPAFQTFLRQVLECLRDCVACTQRIQEAVPGGVPAGETT